MPPSLISPDIINHKLLTNIDARNKLFNQLALTPVHDKKRIYKLICALWLGSGISISALKRDYDYFKYELSIITGYRCFLTLDKNFSHLQSLNYDSLALDILKSCQLYLLRSLNKNFVLLENNPELFFEGFKRKILSINAQLIEGRREKNILIEATNDCLEYLQFLQEKLKNDSKEKFKKKKRFAYNSLPVTQQKLGEFANRITTANCEQHILSEILSPIKPEKNYWMKSLLLQNKDKIILEGAQIRTKKKHQKRLSLL